MVLHATGPFAKAVASARRWIIVNSDERAPAERARLTRRGFWLEQGFAKVGATVSD